MTTPDDAATPPPPSETPPAPKGDGAPPADAGGSGDGGDGGSGDGDGLGALIDEKLHGALEALGLTDDGGTDGGAVTTPPAPRTAAAHESDLQGRIAVEVAKLRADEKRDEKIATIEKAIERPPVKQSTLSRFFWGKVDA